MTKRDFEISLQNIGPRILMKDTKYRKAFSASIKVSILSVDHMLTVQILQIN